MSDRARELAEQFAPSLNNAFRRLRGLTCYAHDDNRVRDERNMAEALTPYIRKAISSEREQAVEALKDALGPLARNGGYYKPEVPHFEQVAVPLEYLRRAHEVYTRLFGPPPSFEEERGTPSVEAPVSERVEVEEFADWLEELLYENDPSCSREDCRYTARHIAPKLIERFASLKDNQGS